jgi:RNA polymerase sigma-70 factor (ECF subfamily)
MSRHSAAALPAPPGTELIDAATLSSVVASDAEAANSDAAMQVCGQPPGDDPGAAEARLLAADIAAGDAAAEARLARRYMPAVLGFLRSRCGDRELASDLAQETFSIALVRLRCAAVDNPAALAGFLRGIASNLLANEMRRSERRLVTGSGGEFVELGACEDDPCDRAENEDLVRRVRTVIGRLSVARDRELLWSFYVDQTSKSQLCARYRLSPEHFDRVLHRARLRLRELWRDRRPDPAPAF